MTASPSTPDVPAFMERGARLTTILLIGRVSTGTRDDLCRIRNISPGGMRIETLAPLDIGQQIEVELKNGMAVRSEVVWVGKAEAGVRFDAPVDIERLLAPAPAEPAKGVRILRSPRVSARCPVALRCDGRILAAVLTDVSQGGVQLEWSSASTIGTQVLLVTPGLASRRATVRWVRGDCVGLSFEERLGFADLAQWLASPHRFAHRSSGQATTAAPAAGPLSRSR